MARVVQLPSPTLLPRFSRAKARIFAFSSGRGDGSEGPADRSNAVARGRTIPASGPDRSVGCFIGEPPRIGYGERTEDRWAGVSHTLQETDATFEGHGGHARRARYLFRRDPRIMDRWEKGVRCASGLSEDGPMSGWKPCLVALSLSALLGSSAEAQGVVPGG